MDYVSKVLQPGETVLHAGSVSRMTYLPGLGLIAISVPVGLYAADGEYWPVLLIAGLFFLIGLIKLIGAWWARLTTEIAVTDRRVIVKRGFVWRATLEMNMSQVESVQVVQSVMGRILGYGDIVIKGTGGGWDPVRNIDSPLDLRNKVTAR